MGRVQIRVVMVSVAVAALVLVAAILGSVAERASSKSFAGYSGGYCVYRRTAALGCGVAAALFLLASQAVLGAASGCFGRCGEARARPIQQRRRTIVASMAGIYWSLTAAMTALFLYAASRNVGGSNLPRRGRYHSMRGCKVFDRGVFSSASITSAMAAFVGITAYVYQETADTDESQVASPGVPLEQRPHFQPQQSYPAVGYPGAPPPYGGYGAKAPAGTA